MIKEQLIPMKKIIFALLLSILCSKLYSQEIILNAENLRTIGLKGKVKTMKETSFTAKKTTSGIIKSTKGWQYTFEYDSESFFDTLGNLVLENNLNLGKKEAVYSIQYDSLHRISAVNRQQLSHHFAYDSLNRISSSYKTDPRSKTLQTSYFTYDYNTKNQLIKAEEFNENTSISVESFLYDTLGNLVSRELKRGPHTETHRYTYNADQLLVKDEWKDNEEGTLETTSYSYKNKEKILEHWIEFENGKSNGYIDDTFENGNIVLSTEVEADGTASYPEQYTYEFDSHGNWIRKTIHTEEEYFIVERIIEYY